MSRLHTSKFVSLQFVPRSGGVNGGADLRQKVVWHLLRTGLHHSREDRAGP